ncbi:MAG: hypothetical protein V1874_07225 [Spirochaetota bacterium]
MLNRREKKIFGIAALLYAVLIILIYFGSYLKYLLNYSWFGNAAVIVVIFIWVTVFLIATVLTAKGVFLIKERMRGKERLDFTAWLGVLIADYSQSGKKIDLQAFFKMVCKENGVSETPDLKKYYNKQKMLKDTREVVFEELRQEIEDAADSWSNEKK